MKKNNGFTLVELMITVAIIGILSAIAYPAYTSYVWKSRQAEAKTIMMRNAQMLERFYTVNNGYASWSIASGVQFYPETATASGSAFYQYTFTASGNQAYTLTMAPGTANKGPDTTKVTLTLKNTGEKGCTKYNSKGCENGSNW